MLQNPYQAFKPISRKSFIIFNRYVIVDTYVKMIYLQIFAMNFSCCFFLFSDSCAKCHNPTLRECEDETHTPEMGTWESFGTSEISEFDYRGKNTLHWGILYIIEKLSKCRCRKWARMSHLDICSTSYGKKKGWESNWQFDSRPLKVGNRPDPDACRGSSTHHQKALNKSYNSASDLVPIRGLSKELQSHKVARV